MFDTFVSTYMIICVDCSMMSSLIPRAVWGRSHCVAELVTCLCFIVFVPYGMLFIGGNYSPCLCSYYLYSCQLVLYQSVFCKLRDTIVYVDYKYFRVFVKQRAVEE